eukprot:3695051-Rhodomonas_salina.6
MHCTRELWFRHAPCQHVQKKEKDILNVTRAEIHVDTESTDQTPVRHALGAAHEGHVAPVLVLDAHDPALDDQHEGAVV